MPQEPLTPRTRFIRHALFQAVDRPPYIETHGFWPQAVERWHCEGLPPRVRHKNDLPRFNSGDITIEQYFDQEVYAWPPFWPGPTETPLWPPFKKEILSETQDTIVFRDPSGVVREDVKQGRTLPKFLQFPVRSRADWDRLKARLDPADPTRYDAARQAVAAGFNQRPNLVVFPICGAYGLPRNLLGEENLAYAYYDDPALIRDIAETWLSFYIEAARRLCTIADFDFVYFWEDMAFKTGPLIGPELVREFMVPYYRQLIPELRRAGLRVFCFDTDGNAKPIMDDFIDAGINSFLPCEIAADMDPLWISNRYGRRCSIQGGIDKRCLTKGKAEIRAEVLRNVPLLLSRGGYIPGVDHAVPSDVPFESFCYLVELLRQLGQEIQPDLSQGASGREGAAGTGRP